METKHSMSALYGVQIITYEEGLQVGKVSEVYLEKASKRLTGMAFSSGIIGFGKEGFVSFADIHRIGKDAIIISSKLATHPLPDNLEDLGLKALKNLKVMTVNGDELGKFSDFTVFTGNGEISSLVMENGQCLDIQLDDLTIGIDALMVPEACASQCLKSQEKANSLHNLHADVQSIKETVKGAIKETVGKFEKKVGQVFRKSEPDQNKETSNIKFNGLDDADKP